MTPRSHQIQEIHKMLGQLFIFLFLISPSHSCLLSDKKAEETLVPYGEPFFVRCPLEPPKSNNSYNITWFINGSNTEISTNLQARIHQNSNYLKFFPARLEDSGFYLCVYRDTKECRQEVLEVNVFQNDNGLCYKEEALYTYRHFRDKSLECQPLNMTTDKYLITNQLLSITDVIPQDNGHYTCVTSFIHNGTNYNISRSIANTIQELPLTANLKPNILYPTDNFIDAELGTSVTVTCAALLSRNLDLIWRYNDSFISDYSDDGRVIDGILQYEAVKDGEKVECRNITFSSVKEEDYGLRFYCYADSISAYSQAFFILKRPGPNLQGLLIAIFVTAAFLIISTIIIIKLFKVDLVLWYRSSCFSHPHQNDGKMYDAYIMYPKNAIGNSAYDMDLFVLKLLPEVLEKQCAYKLFIFGRDDLPGQAIADLVDEAISQSRRLIIVLGQVSNESNLGVDFEQKIAMYDALIRNEIKVILIEMEKITDCTFMPESIKYIRQKQGVVRWKGTFTEASLSPNTRFWKNIRYRMPPAPRHSDKDLDYISTEN
ncbi:interleukin-1 receptor type 1 isoform X2 [Rana temporaria]|uniref:interleukin-1 receptor type 1 isoform X2 n=1 Tax=Rana temporaria TaxID=8407 RepID=UPI001AADB9B7|nr:interleukin-1 receptor type 1 isoform X2 [Rana temporaria]